MEQVNPNVLSVHTEELMDDIPNVNPRYQPTVSKCKIFNKVALTGPHDQRIQQQTPEELQRPEGGRCPPELGRIPHPADRHTVTSRRSLS